MKTIAVVKLNRGAWMDYREQLIRKHRMDGSLVSYSDENLVTNDTTYLVKIIPVNVNFLDPLIGFEGNADALDMLTFINSVRDKLLKDYMPSQPEPTSEEIAPELPTAVTIKPTMPIKPEQTDEV